MGGGERIQAKAARPALAAQPGAGGDVAMARNPWNGASAMNSIIYIVGLVVVVVAVLSFFGLR